MSFNNILQKVQQKCPYQWHLSELEGYHITFWLHDKSDRLRIKISTHKRFSEMSIKEFYSTLMA